MDYTIREMEEIAERAREIANGNDDLKSAYLEAWAEYLVARGERGKLRLKELDFLDMLCELMVDFGGPVLMKHIEGKTGWGPSYIWSMLVGLEQRGQVERPDGPRGGWIAVKQN